MPRTCPSNEPPAPERKTAGFRASRTTPATARRTSESSAKVEAAATGGERNRSAPPLPKRNKGRFFVGSIFFVFLAVAGYFCWSTFFQYQAWGVIEGRVITVSAPWNGIVVNWQIKEGELVKQGQSLAEITNLEMRHAMESLLDDLKLIQAQLDSETAKLKFEKQNRQNASQQTLAEYLQYVGELKAEEAYFADLQKQLTRAKKLISSKNLSQQKYDELYFQFVGQGKKLEKMNEAVAVMEQRTRLSQTDQGFDWQQQIQPLLAKLQTTRSEIERIREKIGQGQLLAPVTGRITQRLCLTGESVDRNEHVVEILEDNSTEAILYIPQRLVGHFFEGRLVEVELPPYQQNLRCEVVRLADEFEPPPNQIKRYYATDEVLLAVHLKPLPEYEQLMSLRINGTVKMPVEWDRDVSTFVSWIGGLARELVTTHRPDATASNLGICAEPGNIRQDAAGHGDHRSNQHLHLTRIPRHVGLHP